MNISPPFLPEKLQNVILIDYIRIGSSFSLVGSLIMRSVLTTIFMSEHNQGMPYFINQVLQITALIYLHSKILLSDSKSKAGTYPFLGGGGHLHKRL